MPLLKEDTIVLKTISMGLQHGKYYCLVLVLSTTAFITHFLYLKHGSTRRE